MKGYNEWEAKVAHAVVKTEREALSRKSESAGSVSKKQRRITRFRKSEWPWIYPLPAIALTTNSTIEGEWCRFAFIVVIFRDTWIFKFGVKKQNEKE